MAGAGVLVGGGGRVLAVAGGLSAVALLAGGAAAASPGTGGVRFVATPKISKVSCLRDCGSRKRPRAGALLRVSGRNMEGVTKVVFHGARGKRDDAATAVRRRSSRRVTARVPLDAGSGPVSVWAGEDVRSRRTRSLPVLPPPPPEASPELTPAPGPREPGAPRLDTGTSQARFYFGAERQVAFSYRVRDDAPASVQVELVRAADGAVVRTWTPGSVPPGTVQSVSWDGLGADGSLQPEGRYGFRVVARAPSGAQARSAQAQDLQRDAFDFHGHVFPIRGRHDYGGDGARFGAGRSGHSHQGQDVFARCGTRLVAARGGVVKFKQYHSAAGHYLVIDGDRTDVDYAYMHLQQASPFDEGDRVHTGQQIGRVGETGNARGCHLHFEMWGAPGWYDGGSPFDPYPSLLAWDAVS